MNYLLGLVTGGLVLANLVLLLSREFAGFVLLDMLFLLSLAVEKKRTKTSWGELFFGWHVVPYSVIRHVGFLMGYVRKPANPVLYPSGERIIQETRPLQLDSAISSRSVQPKDPSKAIGSQG